MNNLKEKHIKFIPKEKMSKKKQRELNVVKRSDWGMCPITRRVENKRLYNRKKVQNGDDFRNEPSFLLFKMPIDKYI
ncbi:MAG: hypothetical protein K0S55_162 [Clostridia bacterium]|jgi:hypothetical protein|nr:hypothetical protein [Clostridia bacterium]